MITIPFDIEQINNQLLSKFGSTPDGKQKFRIVWSDDQIEKRRTSYANGLYLLYPKVELVKKYAYIKEKWVMETWVPYTLTDEIISIEGGSYEPIWTFQDSEGKALRPVYRAAEIIALAAEGKFFTRRTEKDDKDEYDAGVEKEAQEFEELLGIGRNFGHQKDAFVPPVFMDSTKQKARK